MLGPILCDSYLYESPFSLTYGVNLPSSLTRVFSRVLEFSSLPPVSVYGTGAYIISLEAFLGSLTRYSLTSVSNYFSLRFFLQLRLDTLTLIHLMVLSLPPSSLLQSYKQFWILNQMSIRYAFRPLLRSRLTQGGRTFPWKPWVFDGWDSHPSSRYLHRHSHFYTVQ